MIRASRIDGGGMTGQVIDGREIAGDLKAEVAGEVQQFEPPGLTAGIATVLIGGDAASGPMSGASPGPRRNSASPGSGTGLRPMFPQAGVLAEIGRLNADPAVNGILVLRPVPAQISEEDIFTALDPVKDIEAVHPENAGLLALGQPRYVPSTPAAVFHVLDAWLAAAGEDPAAFYHRSLITVVGRSNNVGKRAVSLAYDRQAAVESVDEWASRAGRLGFHTRRADVIDSTAGVPRANQGRARPRGRGGARCRHQPGHGPRHWRCAGWPATWTMTRSPRGCGPSRPFPAGSAR